MRDYISATLMQAEENKVEVIGRYMNSNRMEMESCTVSGTISKVLEDLSGEGERIHAGFRFEHGIKEVEISKPKLQEVMKENMR